MTLTYQLDLDILLRDIHAKIQVCNIVTNIIVKHQYVKVNQLC